MTNKPAFAMPATSDINELRARLRAMSNRELRNFGIAARLKCSESKPGDPQNRQFAVELEVALAEWRCRYSKKTKRKSDNKKEHTDA